MAQLREPLRHFVCLPLHSRPLVLFTLPLLFLLE
jgi:hypothetical protein